MEHLVPHEYVLVPMLESAFRFEEVCTAFSEPFQVHQARVIYCFSRWWRFLIDLVILLMSYDIKCV